MIYLGYEDRGDFDIVYFGNYLGSGLPAIAAHYTIRTTPADIAINGKIYKLSEYDNTHAIIRAK